MQRSESISTLAKALAQAQAKIKNPEKGQKNSYYGNMYADLAEVLNMIREAFAPCGLSIVQNPSFKDGILAMETILLHESGEWMSSILESPVPPPMAKDGRQLPMGPQAIGSATTYLRRYGAAAMAGIAQEDDDGEGAQDKTKPAEQPRQPQQRPPQDKPAVNTDDKIHREVEQWSIEEQSTFAELANRLYKAFKVASTSEKYTADAERWRANMAKDPAATVLPAMRKWTETLEAAAAKKQAPPQEPAA